MRPVSNKQCSTAFSTAKLFDLEAERLVWIDMEMTGLNVDQDKIMEVACIVTDTDLNIVAEGLEIVINQPKETLDNMHECQLIKPIFKMRPLSNKQCSNAFSTAKLFDLRAERLVWIDMEMTGLNVDQDNIMEVACIVTDTDLNIVAEGPEIVINHAKETLENMHE
ncbi:hypothetical protein YQE_09352, partial [Dendroctonus ponderosae]